MSRTKHLVWFRQDFRVEDNPALYHACNDPDAEVIAVYGSTPKQWLEHGISGRQIRWCYHHLLELKKSLATLNIPLFYEACSNFDSQIEWLESFCAENDITHLFYNYQYEFNERKRDVEIKRRLKENILVQGFHANLIFPPKTIVNQNSEMYKVFTPFKRKALEYLSERPVSCFPIPSKRTLSDKLNRLLEKSQSENINDFDYPEQVDSDLKIGENAASEQLQYFLLERVQDYTKDRDFPSIDGTSQLSAYLAIGVISVKKCLWSLIGQTQDLFSQTKEGEMVWLSELLWREFYYQLMITYPKLSKNQPFIEWTRNIHWQDNSHYLEAWCSGQTGFPIIDAAMRQLNETGWMHNRLRMIVASFLVKDLHIDWRQGENYFFNKLIDADLAANNGGWQWAASTGTDSVPYFRIFNPTTQGSRFDADGIFIKKWLPELKEVPKKYIHTPHLWAEENGVALNYPYPIVDHKAQRLQTLKLYEEAKLWGELVQKETQ